MEKFMYIENNYLILEDYDLRKVKKITATSFYGLLGENKFKPKGDYLLGVLNLLKEPFDPFYAKRGAVAERVLKTWLTRRGYVEKTWDSFEIHFDNFPNNPEFGGQLDGALIEYNGQPMRCVVECKSKNRNDEDKIKRFPNLEQEHQALFYGYLSKCPMVKIFYVFFSDAQENDIRNDIKIDEDPNNFIFYEKDLVFTNEDMEQKLQQALAYKNKCIQEKRIPLSDVSDKALDLLGLERGN